jgi:hypothetical protein
LDLASPTRQVNEKGFLWQKAKVVALAQNNVDELVDIHQRDLMCEVMVDAALEERKDEMIQLLRKHDEIWRKG